MKNFQSNVITITGIQQEIGEVQREKVERFLRREGLEPVARFGPTRVWRSDVVEQCRKALCESEVGITVS